MAKNCALYVSKNCAVLLAEKCVLYLTIYIVPEHDYSIGEKVPENFLWTLNYRTHIKAESEVAEVKEIILESYRKR